MKIAHIFAAALMVAGIGVSAEASAQRYDGYSQNDRGEHGDRGDRRDDRRYDSRDDRRGYGWRNNHRHCRVVYRHHRRYTVCR